MKSLAISLVASALVLAGCSGGSGSEGTIIDTTLADTSIDLSVSTVEAGTVTFAVTNTADQVHEIEVFTGSNTVLPMVKGVADISGMTLIDEIEDILPGGNVRLTLNLPPGDYIIICNLPGHYEMGMVTKLVVTG